MSNKFNFWDRTDLAELAEEGHAVDIARGMLKKNPNLVDLRSSIYQPTPLLAAVSSGHATLEFLQLLVEYHAQLNVTCYGGRNILHCSANAANIEHFKYIMSLPNCPDINSKMENGNTPLHAACMLGNFDATLESRIKIIDFLLDNGADVTITNQLGYTAADAAEAQGLYAIASYINHKINSSTQRHFPHVDGQNSPIDFWDRYRLAALAFEGQDLISASKILNFDINAVDEACQYYPTPLLVALSCGKAKLDFIKLLIDHHADLGAAYPDGKNILHCAANAANPEHFLYIINLDGCPNVNSKMKNGNTALHAVCMQGTTSATLASRMIVASTLMDKGSDPEIKNNEGLTAIELAQYQGLPELSRFINQYDLTKKQASNIYNLVSLQEQQADPSKNPTNLDENLTGSDDETWESTFTMASGKMSKLEKFIPPKDRKDMMLIARDISTGIMFWKQFEKREMLNNDSDNQYSSDEECFSKLKI